MPKEHIIKKVEEGSIAWEMGIEAGDKLLQVNDQEVEDVFDYRFMIHDEEVLLLIEKPDGEQWELEIDKEYDEELGIDFEEGLMDEYRSCTNNCVFCFVHQMPAGMRETLYFQDDDARLSFLQGNYVTLTNMSEEDIDRIIKYNLGPINISIHTMNPKLRVKMLHNRTAGEALKKMDKLSEGGIEMNGQIVLCPGLNDGEELEYSIQEMSKYLPYLQSVSVVPVGLTKYRDGLYPLRTFTREESIQTLETIHKWQEKIYKEHGTHFIHAGDEWYIQAGWEMPQESNYDGYLQLENGVGMVRLLLDEFQQALEQTKGDTRYGHVTIVTATLMEPIMKELIGKLNAKFPNMRMDVKAIVNDFFGHGITITGLITGQDLVKQLQETELGQHILLPSSLLRSGEEVLLDDMTLDQVRKSLQGEVHIVQSSGSDIIESIISKGRYDLYC